MSFRDRTADVDVRVAKDRSGPLLQFCFPFSTYPLGMKGSVYTMSGHPTQGRAGAFVLKYSDRKHSTPASHTVPQTSRRQTSAQRGTWFALSFHRVEVMGSRRQSHLSVCLTTLPSGLQPLSGLALSHPPNHCHDWAT